MSVLKSIGVSHGWDARQYRQLLYDSLFSCFSGGGASSVSLIISFKIIVVDIFPIVLPLAVNQIGIHGIVGIIDADVPGAHTVFGLLVEVDA